MHFTDIISIFNSEDAGSSRLSKTWDALIADLQSQLTPVQLCDYLGQCGPDGRQHIEKAMLDLAHRIPNSLFLMMMHFASSDPLWTLNLSNLFNCMSQEAKSAYLDIQNIVLKLNLRRLFELSGIKPRDELEIFFDANLDDLESFNWPDMYSQNSREINNLLDLIIEMNFSKEELFALLGKPFGGSEKFANILCYAEFTTSRRERESIREFLKKLKLTPQEEFKLYCPSKEEGFAMLEHAVSVNNSSFYKRFIKLLNLVSKADSEPLKIFSMHSDIRGDNIFHLLMRYSMMQISLTQKEAFLLDGDEEGQLRDLFASFSRVPSETSLEVLTHKNKSGETLFQIDKSPYISNSFMAYGFILSAQLCDQALLSLAGFKGEICNLILEEKDENSRQNDILAIVRDRASTLSRFFYLGRSSHPAVSFIRDLANKVVADPLQRILDAYEKLAPEVKERVVPAQPARLVAIDEQEEQDEFDQPENPFRQAIVRHRAIGVSNENVLSSLLSVFAKIKAKALSPAASASPAVSAKGPGQ